MKQFTIIHDATDTMRLTICDWHYATHRMRLKLSESHDATNTMSLIKIKKSKQNKLGY